MEIIDEPSAVTVLRHSRDGAASRVPSEIQRESLLTVNVNDIPTMQVGCSASDLVELVVGRLYTEGLVNGVEDIETISLCENSLRADVYLRDREADLTREAARLVPTCCTNNVVLNDYFGTDEPPHPVVAIDWDDEWVFRVADAFALDRTSHMRTRGSHSAYLADKSGVLYVREDIGRHNALDKAIGAALIDGVDLACCLLFTSGRVPTDMAMKVIRAGVPLLVSKAVPTDRTIEMAREFGLTLICNASPNSFDIVCAPGADLRDKGAGHLSRGTTGTAGATGAAGA